MKKVNQETRNERLGMETNDNLRVEEKKDNQKIKRERKLVGDLWRWFWMASFVVGVVPLCGYQWMLLGGRSMYEKAKWEALGEVGNTERMMDWVELSLETRDVETADKLLADLPISTQDVEYLGSASRKEVILGSRISRLEELLATRDDLVGDKTRELIEKWELIEKNYQGYRDAYLQLAALYFRVKDNVMAKRYLEAAREIDPNSPKVEAVRKIVEARGVIR